MSVLTPDDTILGLLAVQARHGYDLLDCFQRSDSLGEVWSLSTSQIYAVLKRLEREDAISGEKQAVENAPTRTRYRLTETGEQRLMAWLHDPAPSASIRRVRVEFLSRLYVARLLNIPTLPMVIHQRRACREARKRLIEQRAQAAFGVPYLALDLAVEQLDAVLTWIERCELIPKDADESEGE
jgi:DNA-binding PadR family transcriptional regulator